MTIRCNSDSSGGGAGFSLVEVLISVTILMVMASSVTLNVNMLRPTAKGEAEKIAAYIHKVMRRSDRIHDGFAIKFKTHNGQREIWIVWDSKGDSKYEYVDVVPVNSGFYVTSNYLKDNLSYSPQSNTFVSIGRTLTVTRTSDNSYYYVIFYQYGGRIRVSQTPPP